MIRIPYWPATFAFLAAACLTSSGGGEEALKVVKTENLVTISREGKTVLRYAAAPSPFKPYVKELLTPGGVQILRDSPHDHKHHHGLMFAIGVNSVDFWAEAKGAGTQKPVTLADGDVASGIQGNGFVRHLHWIEPQGGKTLLVEKRWIELAPVATEKPVTLINWHSRLSTPPGAESVKLTAEGHHYFGLGMRFVTSMDTGGRFFNASGKPGDVIRGSERLVNAKWSAYTAKADGKPVTVAIFDHPKNPRYPNRMFTMSPPFAYLSATLNLWKEPMTLKASERLDLRWGVALWDGEVPAEQVEEVYNQWTKWTAMQR